MRLMMRNACFIDALIQMFTSFYLSIIVPKRESTDSVRDNKISVCLFACAFALGRAELHNQQTWDGSAMATTTASRVPTFFTGRVPSIPTNTPSFCTGPESHGAHGCRPPFLSRRQGSRSILRMSRLLGTMRRLRMRQRKSLMLRLFALICTFEIIMDWKEC